MKSNNSFYFAVSLVFITSLIFVCLNFYSAQSNLSQSVSSEVYAGINATQSVSSQSESAMQAASGSSSIQAVSLQSLNNVNASDFQQKVINPDLMKLNIYSPSISNLLVGTAIQESLLGKLSKNIFQITLSTAMDINNDYLVKHPKLKAAVNYFYDASRSLSWNLENNVNYEIALASIVYLKANHPLPNATDPNALGRFWKINYNTYSGRGTARQYAVHLKSYLLKDPQLASQFHA